MAGEGGAAIAGPPEGALCVGVVHGPNLNLLGRREPDHYGRTTLSELDALLERRAAVRQVEIVSIQSNHEGILVDWVQERSDTVDGWLVNAGGLTHSSVPLRDALAASGRPFIEVHLSNIFAREDFRRESRLADLAVGVIAGFGAHSYLLGLDALLEQLRAGS